MNLEGKHVMVDLETLGNGSRSVIISIGAVEFNSTEVYSTFYHQIDPQSCVDAGLEMDVSTVMWWMQQSDSARAAFKNKGEPLAEALRFFSAWFPPEGCLWGNGATFDNVILDNAYRVLGLGRPWHYTKDRCYRTVKNLYNHVKPDETGGTAHHALDDAVWQARHLIKIASAV